jgi:hypothetical protein
MQGTVFTPPGDDFVPGDGGAERLGADIPATGKGVPVPTAP